MFKLADFANINIRNIKKVFYGRQCRIKFYLIELNEAQFIVNEPTK